MANFTEFTSAGVYTFSLELDGVVRNSITKLSGLQNKTTKIEHKSNSDKGFAIHVAQPGYREWLGELKAEAFANDSTAWADAWLADSKNVKFKNGKVTMYNQAGIPAHSWTFKDAWVSEYGIDDFDASSASPLKEKITIVFGELTHDS